jgi:hypothetical protein
VHADPPLVPVGPGHGQAHAGEHVPLGLRDPPGERPPTAGGEAGQVVVEQIEAKAGLAACVGASIGGTTFDTRGLCSFGVSPVT